MKAPLYTFYIVTRNADHHYPVLMANNGKAALNEPVKQANKLEQSIRRLMKALDFSNPWGENEVRVVRITEVDFRRKFPKFAPNKGGKRKAVK